MRARGARVNLTACPGIESVPARGEETQVTTPISETPARELDRTLTGRAIGPDDPLYDEARQVKNRIFDRRPAVIARCADGEDVRTAIAFARRHALPLAVRGGGHSVAGFSSLEDGVVVDLSALRDVHVDVHARTADVGGGTTAGDLDAAKHGFGLATPTATVTSVGVGGFALGGGIGHLVRAHGLAADNLVAAELVLASGDVLHVDEEHEPDLLWALRGGGGNFGAVTRMRFRLRPLATVVGGPMLWPLEDAERILPLYTTTLAEQPEEVSAFFAVLTIPPVDPFPPELRLRKACALVWCVTAPAERASAALDVFRAESPLVDAVGELPYPTLQSSFDESAALGSYGVIGGLCYADLPDAAAEAFVRCGETAPTWLSFSHLYPIDGAAAREPEGGAAWPWRGARFAQMVLGASDGPGREDELREWVAAFRDELAPHALGGAYSNFLTDEGPEVARASYGASYERLARIKARFDPDDVFAANQTIVPAP